MSGCWSSKNAGSTGSGATVSASERASARNCRVPAALRVPWPIRRRPVDGSLVDITIHRIQWSEGRGRREVGNFLVQPGVAPYRQSPAEDSEADETKCSAL